MDIRPYNDSDEAAVVALWLEAFPDSPAHNDLAQDLRSTLGVQRQFFLVATEGEDLVGTAMAGYDGHRGWVYYVAVARTARRQGIGTALMREVETRLGAAGCPKLNLQVRATNTEVVEFYRQLGYAIEERVSMGKLLGE